MPWDFRDSEAIDTAAMTAFAQSFDQEAGDASASGAVSPAASEPTEMILVLGFQYQQGVQWGGRHVTIASFTPKDKAKPPLPNNLLADFKEPKMKACLDKRSLPSYNLIKSATTQVAGYQVLTNQGYDPTYARQVEFKSDLLKDVVTCISATVKGNKTWSDRYEIKPAGPDKWHITQYCITSSSQAKAEYDGWFNNGKAAMKLFLNARSSRNQADCAGAVTPFGKPGKSDGTATSSKNCYVKYTKPNCWSWREVKL
eukprot:gene8231-8421_t